MKKTIIWIFALCTPLIAYALYTPLPSEKRPIRFYTNHTRDDLKRTVLKAIDRAESSIWIHTYALTAPSILNALRKKASRGVEVHLFYDRKATPRLDRFASSQLHLHPISTKGLMHKKWIVIDQKWTLLGSANLTPSSLIMHDNLLLGLYSPSLARAIREEKNPHHREKIDGQTLDFFLLPQNAALDHLLTTLDRAQKSVSLALFTFTHPAIASKLLELHNRGVAIALYLDAHAARGSSKGVCETLQKGGIHPSLNRGRGLFHHKWAVVDSKWFILGSANWTRAAFEKNGDFILFLSPLSQKQEKFLKKMTKIIKKESFYAKNF